MLICILGRQPELGMAELEAVVGAEHIAPLGREYAIIKDGAKAPRQDELGGVIKMAEVVDVVQTYKWNKVSAIAFERIMGTVSGAQKIAFGVSLYGMRASPKEVWLLGFAIKRRLKEKGIQARVVMGKDLALNSAQVMNNRLTGENGFEFLIIADQGKTYIARTLSVQDVDSYSKRDYGRPGRDAWIGMLPPKLAQIMLNLAKVEKGTTVIDPFCGTGVVLMEAALRQCKVMGIDIRREMVSATKANLDWLAKEYGIGISYKLVCADSTEYAWKNVERVVSETFLGPSLTKLPEGERMRKIMMDCNYVARKFLRNLRGQLGTGARCCIAVPVWKSRQSIVHLPVVNELADIGYTRVGFSHVRNEQLVYMRPDQIVGRELLVLEPGKGMARPRRLEKQK